MIARLTGWLGARLQRKLLVAFGLPLAVVSALFLAVVSLSYRAQLVAVHARASEQINQLMQGTLENAMLKRDIPGLEAVLAGLGAQEGVARVMILNPELEVRFSSDPERVGERIDSPETRRALSEKTAQSRYLDAGETQSRGRVLRSVDPVRNRTPCRECHGDEGVHPVNGLLVVDYRADAISREAFAGMAGLAVMGLLAIAAASTAMWVGLRRMVLSPLDALSEATERLGAGDLNAQTTLSGRDELASLGQAFNRMSHELAQTLRVMARSEAGLQALIDALPDGLRVIGPDFRIRRANRAFCAQVGLPAHEVIGAPCYRVSHGRDTPCPHTLVTCPVVELIERGSAPLTFRDRHIRAGQEGVAHAVEVSSALVSLNGEGEAQSCVLEAIRDLDVQARISQEERLSEIGLLAAGVAHEIYNPLSSVGFLISSLERSCAPCGRPGAADAFETIRAEIGKCIEITDNLLLLSAPPGEGHTLVEIERVVMGVLSLFNHQAAQERVRIEMALEPGLRVIASDSDMRMLLTNLVLNAFHAMPGGGTVRLSGWRAAGKVHLAVADTGVGIAPADLERIFMPFWSRRADSTAGRGLGLAIVRAILERHTAQIAVDSRLGAGSTFTLTFADPDIDALS